MCIGIVYTLHIAHSCCLWKAVGQNIDAMQISQVLLSIVLLGAAARRRGSISRGLELFGKIKALWGELDRSEDMKTGLGAFEQLIWKTWLDQLTFDIFLYIHIIFTCQLIQLPLGAVASFKNGITVYQDHPASVFHLAVNGRLELETALTISFSCLQLRMLTSEGWACCHGLNVQGQLFEPHGSRTSVAFCIGTGWRCLPVHQMTMIRTLRWATAATDQKGTHRAQPQLHEVERWRPQPPTADQHAGNVADHYHQWKGMKSLTCMQAAHVEICWVFLMVLSLLSHFSSQRSSVSPKPSSSNPVLKCFASIKDI